MLNAPNVAVSTLRATRNPSRKLLRLETAWSPNPHPTRAPIRAARRNASPTPVASRAGAVAATRVNP